MGTNSQVRRAIVGGMHRLPDFALTADGPASAGLRAHGITDYRSAAAWIEGLPYGRGRGRDELDVLTELRGTCSTKHALLARAAREHSVAVELVLGIYLMDGDNTPGVGEALARHGLARVPEAHCVLRWQGEYVDITRAGSRGVPEFMYTEVLKPEDIAVHKIAVHRAYLLKWISTQLPGWTLERVWAAREACIAALAVTA